MIYEARVLVPANTSQDAPVEQSFSVHPGTVQQVEVQFPSGCAGLVHAVIKYQEIQVWPSNLDQDFIGDDTHLIFPEDLEVSRAPYQFSIEAWSEDDTFEHTVIARLAIVKTGGTIQELLEQMSAMPGRA